MSNKEVAIPEFITLEDFLSDDFNDLIINIIDDQFNGYVPNISTKKGRDEIKAMAYKITRSKTLIDKLGKELADGWRADIARVNEKRKALSKIFDDRKTKFRKPLTDFEMSEETRVRKFIDLINFMDQLSVNTYITSAAVKTDIEKLKLIVIDKYWDEYQDRGLKSKNAAAYKLGESLSFTMLRENETIELEALRKQVREDEKSNPDRQHDQQDGFPDEGDELVIKSDDKDISAIVDYLVGQVIVNEEIAILIAMEIADGNIPNVYYKG